MNWPFIDVYMSINVWPILEFLLLLLLKFRIKEKYRSTKNCPKNISDLTVDSIFFLILSQKVD